jgi:hypothetical protein
MAHYWTARKDGRLHIIVPFEGKVYTLKELCGRFQVSPTSVRQRMDCGVVPELAFRLSTREFRAHHKALIEAPLAGRSAARHGAARRARPKKAGPLRRLPVISRAMTESERQSRPRQ